VFFTTTAQYHLRPFLLLICFKKLNFLFYYNLKIIDPFLFVYKNKLIFWARKFKRYYDPLGGEREHATVVNPKLKFIYRNRLFTYPITIIKPVTVQVLKCILDCMLYFINSIFLLNQSIVKHLILKYTKMALEPSKMKSITLINENPRKRPKDPPIDDKISAKSYKSNSSLIKTTSEWY
jgi:hypothetical protein